MTTILHAKAHKAGIDAAVAALNSAVKDAAREGVVVAFDLLPFRAIGHKPYELLNCTVTVDIAVLENDNV